MAAKKFKLDQEAFRKVRQDPRVRADLLDRAQRLAAAAGGEAMGYKVTELVLEDPRAAVSVMATGHAHFHNRKHHALLRNLNAAKD
jgi:hypothetical protein